MKFGKFLVFLVALMLGGAVYFVMLRKEGGNLARQEQDNFFNDTRQAGRRGDDPTYAEEMKQNAAITLATQRKQKELEEQLANEKAEAERKQANLSRQLEEMNKNLVNLRDSQSKNGEVQSAAVQKEVDARMAQINESLINLQKQQNEIQVTNQARIAELEQQLQAAQAAATVPTDAMGDSVQSSATQVPGLPDVYGSGAITLPYQGMRGENGIGGVARIPHAGVDYGADEGAGDILDSLQRGISRLTGGVAQRDPDILRDRLPQAGEQRRQEQWETVFPVYTLPPNTILANAMLVTPIIGRVPLPNRGNKVEDPFFFKVEIGAANIAANGHQIPGVAKMIVSRLCHRYPRPTMRTRLH